MHLWALHDLDPRPVEAVLPFLQHGESNVSFHAASVLAIWGEPGAEVRLLRAITDREEGPEPDQPRVPGPHGQCIDIPFWLQAVVLLRCCGTARCLPALRELANHADPPFNVLTCIATTLGKLAGRGIDPRGIREIAGLLQRASAHSEAVLPPSRSLWKILRGEPRKPPANDRGADTREDHSWQLRLILDRILRPSGGANPAGARDPRGYVRAAFAEAGGNLP